MLLALILQSTLTFAAATPAAADDSYTQLITCVGSTIAQPNREKAKLTFRLNHIFEEGDERLHPLDIHMVKIETPGFFSTATVEYAHPHYNKDCVRTANHVSCSGYGVGTGEQEFQITVDLATRRATGVYKSMYPSDTSTYEFTAANPLRCKL